MQGHNLALDDHLHSSVLKMEAESWKAEAAYYAGTMCTFAAHRKVVGRHVTGFKFYFMLLVFVNGPGNFGDWAA